MRNYPFAEKLLLAVMVLGLTMALPQTGLSQGAGGKMYWIDSDSGKIQRADLDGTNVEDLVTGLDGPVGIALDLSGGKMYWTDIFSDNIQRADLDGTNVEELVTGLGYPQGIALDVSAGKMYWTNEDKIQRAHLDGTNVEDLFTSGTGDAMRIVLDVSGGKMYWTHQDGSKIRRADLDGTNVEDLVTGLGGPVGIALDLSGGKMYWTDIFSENIHRADLDGTNVEALFAAGYVYSLGIALDVSGGKMYWTDGLTGMIHRADLAGTNVEDLVSTGIYNYLSGIGLDVADASADSAVIGHTSVTMGSGCRIKMNPAGATDVASNGTLDVGAFSEIHGNVQSDGDMTLGSRTKVFMDAATNNRLTLGSFGFIGGGVTAGHNVKAGDENVHLFSGARVDGDITAGGEVLLDFKASVGGAVTPNDHPRPVSTALLPDCPVSAPGGDDLATRSYTGPHHVVPGDHGDYVFGSRNRVIFEPGVYSFRSLLFGSYTMIEIKAPATVHIADRLVFQSGVKETLSSGEAEQITYRIGPGGYAEAGSYCQIIGTFCGPGAEVNINSCTMLEGAVYADVVTFGSDVKICDTQQTCMSIVSDHTWKSWDIEVADWETPGFDDTGWRNTIAPYPNPSDPEDFIPGTQAVYMWDTGGPVEAWFRKTFDLPWAPGSIGSATAILAADDDFDFYVNGILVYSDWDNTASTAPFTVDIKPYLVQGENVFAMYAKDTAGGYEWALVDATIVK